MANIIKIVRLKKIIDGLLLYVENNFNSLLDADQVQDSFLYRLLYGNNDGNYNFYENAKEMFVAGDEKVRKIKTSLMFNKDVNQYPHIHVRELTNIDGDHNAIGGFSGDIYQYQSGAIGETIRNSRDLTYEVMVTCGNALDVVCMGEVLMSLMVASQQTFSDEFKLYSYSMKDITLTNTNGNTLFGKTITLRAEHTNFIPSIVQDELITSFNFVLTNINGEDLITDALQEDFGNLNEDFGNLNESF